MAERHTEKGHVRVFQKAQRIYTTHQTNNYIKEKYQVIDTPGLLDRPFLKRNDIEKQAVAALSYLADLIIFILDPSETCGYTLKDQYNLLEQIKKIFSNITIFLVENKVDIKKGDSSNLMISCDTGLGIDQLKENILSFFEEKK